MANIAKYNPQLHNDWAWSLAIKGKTDEEIATEMGINRKTIQRWSKTKDDKGEQILTSFGEKLQEGKKIANAKVEKSLYQRTQGYEVEETKKIISFDKNGNSLPVKVESIKKHIPPDTMACIYWLNNRCKKTGEWSQTQKVDVEIDNNGESVVIYVPDNGRDRGDREIMNEETRNSSPSGETG